MSQPLRMKCPSCGTEGQHRLVRTYPSSYKWPEAKKLFTHLLGDIPFHFRQHVKKCLRRKCQEFSTVEMPKHFLDRLIEEVHYLNVKAQCFDIREKAMEQAEFFHSMLEEGLRQKEIAEITGYTEGHISQRLVLLKAPPEMQEKVRKGEMKAEDVVTFVRQQERGVN